MATQKITRKPIKTQLQFDKLKSSDKPYDVKVADASGLVVRVSKTGIKSFRWDRGAGKKPRIITYNKHSTLQEARDLHAKARQQQRGSDGFVPVVTKADGKAAEKKLVKPKTVNDLSEWFYEDRIIPHRKRPGIVRQVLDHDILPVIGKMRIDAVETLHVRHLVKAVVDRGATVHAGRVLSITKQLFRHGVQMGVMKYNTAQPLEPMGLGIKDNQRDRNLSSSEIKQFWNKLEESPTTSPQAKVALQLLILLGLRSGELRQAEWQHVDLDAGLLTIPVKNQKLSPKQAKKAKPFVVPLDNFAVDLLKQLQGMDAVWVFPGPVDDKPFSTNVLSRVVGRLIDDMEAFTPHDLRRTMRSGLSKLDIQPHVAERCLNHSLGKIQETYDTHDYLNERREALEKWSQHVQIILGKHDNVVSMEAAVMVSPINQTVGVK